MMGAGNVPPITLTWPQQRLLIELLDEFISEYTGSDVAMARRIMLKLSDAEARWYAAHPEAQADLDEIKRGVRQRDPLPPSRQIPERTGSAR